MKKLKVKVCCSAYYETTMEVPDNLNFNEAITYAQKNLQNIPVHELILMAMRKLIGIVVTL